MTERTLVLLRHAKAEPATGAEDADRPLTSRGHADAAAAGAWLSGQGYRPDLVICSTVKRTRQTWHAVAAALTGTKTDQARPADQGGVIGPEVRYERRLYDSPPAELLRLLQGIGQDIHSVLVIGHNPTISQLSALLDPQVGLDSDGLRTCGIAVHRVTRAWSECGSCRAPLAASHTARS